MPLVDESSDNAMHRLLKIKILLVLELLRMCILELGVGFLFPPFICTGYPFPSNFQWYLLVNLRYFLT